MLRILRKKDFGKLKAGMKVWIECTEDNDSLFYFKQVPIKELCVSVEDKTWEQALAFDLVEGDCDIPRFLNYDLYCERRALLINEKEFSNELDR